MIINAENVNLDNSLFSAIINTNQACPFHNHMDIRIKKLELGQATLETYINKRHINPQNIAHGGVAYSLADTAMGMAIRTLNRYGLTIEMNINYIKPIYKDNILTAVGKVLELGKKIIIVQAYLSNQDDELIGVARGTFYNKGDFMDLYKSQQ